MTEQQLLRMAKRRLAILRHAEEITGNVALTCRYYGISRQVFYKWRRRYDAHGGVYSAPPTAPGSVATRSSSRGPAGHGSASAGGHLGRPGLPGRCRPARLDRALRAPQQPGP
jgi:hypothetical protein